MEFEIVLPCGGSIDTFLSSKELRGSHLLDNIYKNVQVAADTRDYFGICYTDKGDGGKNWILPEDNLRSHNFFSGGGGRIQLQFEVRIFPKDPDLIFPTADSRRMFRQHMKTLLTNNQVGCDNKTSAMLDAFIVQAELGDYIDTEEDYFQKINDIEIYAPISLCSGTPLTEIQYLKLMRMYHKRLNGMSPEQADILYLSLVQKIPMYGYALYHISDKEHKGHFLALAYDGIHFIYESCLEKFIAPRNKETIKWEDLLYCEIVRKKIKIGFKLPNNTSDVIVDKFFKIKTKYAHKGASRFKADFNKHKEIFVNDQPHSSTLFNSRKEAYLCHSGQLPRRMNTFSGKVNSIRESFKHQKWKVRATSSKQIVGTYNEQNV